MRENDNTFGSHIIINNTWSSYQVKFLEFLRFEKRFEASKSLLFSEVVPKHSRASLARLYTLTSC